MGRVTDDDCREVARRLRSLDDSELQVYDMTYFAIQRAVGGGGDQHPDGRELADRLADLIEPAPTSSDAIATHTDASATRDTSQSRRDTVASDPTERGIDSIYDWCFERIEGADGAEDHLYCSIMSAIEDYRHPERVTARTARAVDREALLALADELTEMLTLEAFVNYPSEYDVVSDVSRRIREACGEQAS